MNYNQKITNHLKKYDLDIRKSKFSRFMDQKVTPDVLCFIAECILNFTSSNKVFTRKDIEKSTYFEKNVRAIYGKPSPKNKTASREYDKFVGQPLRILAYSQILNSKIKGRGYEYSINEESIFEFISIKERNASIFLYAYIIKVLKDSSQLKFFEKFKNKCISNTVEKEDYLFLKNKYIQFIKGNTGIEKDYEIPRIFPKILNIYSYHNEINGSQHGTVTKHIFNFSDLMYNHENWRDIGKSKGLTRIEFENRAETIFQQKTYHTYLIEKAKEKIKKKYIYSEIKDRFSKGVAVHVHHIFPKSTHPDLSFYLENLIKLTASQHLQQAHTNGNTRTINKDYQCVCLLAKSQSIEDSISHGELFYTKPNFVYIINEGLKLDLYASINFTQIRTEINKSYNSV